MIKLSGPSFPSSWESLEEASTEGEMDEVVYHDRDP